MKPTHGKVPDPVLVTTAAESAALDASTIASGTSPAELMRRAGESAASEILRRFGESVAGGVAVFAGAGNNGGDGWVVGAALAREGIVVTVVELGEPRTEEARSARSAAKPMVNVAGSWGGQRIVVDAFLGTGFAGAPRGPAVEGLAAIARAAEAGASVVALDVPSGLDATTGDSPAAVRADMTITFGTLKRGILRARERCGAVVVTDIGLQSSDKTLPSLVTPEMVRAWLPAIPADAHKGLRGRVVIAGGAQGMAGAAILAASGALRAGAGTVKLCVARETVDAVHGAIPAAMVATWEEAIEGGAAWTGWADALTVGPGLGRSDTARALVAALAASDRPVVFDADALNLAGPALESADTARQSSLFARKSPTVVTPHPGEMARLLGAGGADEVDRDRYVVTPNAAARSGAIVLLKGVPTIIADPAGRVLVCATGTAALATGGAGDLLAGMIATLLAQAMSPMEAAAAAAWVHGHAAELATGGEDVRGVTLEDVIARVREAWQPPRVARPDYVLAELPAPA